MIRLAMLSFWHLHGKDYAQAAQEHPDTKIVAVWDEDPARGREEAVRWGARFYDDLGELLANPEIDAVVVDTPTSAHKDVIIAAARAGKHIFTEKVIAPTLQDTQEIVREVAASGVTFMVSMWRSDEAYTEAITNILNRGLLGTITQLRIRDGHPLGVPTPEHPRGYLPEQFYNVKESLGGALIDLCHPVYLLAHFLGRPSSVSAAFGYVTRREIEDNAIVTFHYPDGAIGVAETSYVSAYTPFSIEAHGTKGSLLYSEDGIGELVARSRSPHPERATSQNGPDGKLYLRSDLLDPESTDWEPQELPAGPHPKAFDKWVTHIRSGTTAPENVALGIELSAVIEASYRSASTGATMHLDSTPSTGEPTADDLEK
ncbi:Gfo/Idh/MocA family oxidoreductase [Pseudarthrobacter sulfonivorans]|uniref:Gfo/Idh/MocA family protein n=1 Tax=Pseudarthrobacter sulfonivorans TaxID=121292 RepID=UPI002864D78A|nr:Gfo/Idh/MocA family oxidoreductase [Pseudarthrobacter sulfonivorans]MDR6417616.1 putative dehydrogenase [Pseudarthrobacter sulfonivorans]